MRFPKGELCAVGGRKRIACIPRRRRLSRGGQTSGLTNDAAGGPPEVCDLVNLRVRSPDFPYELLISGRNDAPRFTM